MPALEEIHTVLQRLEFPATKEELIDQARRRDAPVWMLDRLHALPEHRYGSVDTVMDALRHRD